MDTKSQKKKPKSESQLALALGADLSLNHGAVVLLRGDQIRWFAYYTSLVGSAARSPLGARLPTWKTKDRHVLGMLRLAWVEAWFKSALSKAQSRAAGAPLYVNIEDYALDVDHGSAYQGEVGAAARLACWHAGVPFRLTDPTTAKMYIALNGRADKDLVESQALERFGVDFGAYNGPPAARAKKENRQTSQDLADAFGLAHLCYVETQLRAGTRKLSSLHPKEIQVFNRITKAQPTGLLDRDWISKESA